MATAPSPLSHHDILGIVEPFTRRSRQVDLAASDRLNRRLQFKPVDHAGNPAGFPALRETLQLDSYRSGNFELTRTLTAPDGQTATLQTSGPQPAALLARIEAVAPEQQFVAGAGALIARSYTVSSDVTTSADGRTTVPLVLTRAVVHLNDLTLTLSVPATRGVSADITLTPKPTTDGSTLALPDDLLAVIGWDWTRLVRKKGEWDSKLRLRGGAARRTRLAEQAADRVARHLAQTLAEPPAQFHERHLRARWWAALRRAIPILTPVSLVVTVLLFPRIDFGEKPGLWLMLYHLPTALIALSFCLQELPEFVIPPLPRRSEAPTWRVPPSAAVSAQPGTG
jgi:hypothetical protein